jgi:hypothetical protein
MIVLTSSHRRLRGIAAAGLLLFAAVPAAAWAGGSTAVQTPPPVAAGHVWVAAAVAVVALLLLTLVLCGFSLARVGRLFIGKDLRASTSKTQAAAWTFAICFALLVLLAGHLLYDDFDPGWRTFLDQGLNSDYLWLLGIPAAGLVGAKTITETKVAADPAAKQAKPATADDSLATRLAELSGDDSGQPAIADLQYLVFNVITLLYFLSAFLEHPERGLPTLPDSLIALTGVSAAAYLGTKAATRTAAATIVSVRPSRVALRQAPVDLVISGSGFLPAGVPGPPGVTLDGVDLPVAPNPGDTRIVATVPAQSGLSVTAPARLDLVVYTPAGTPSAASPIDVEP